MYLGFDVGGTKTAWGLFTEEGKMLKSGKFMTPKEPEPFIASLLETIRAQKDVIAVGIGIAGTIKPDHTGTILCVNLPQLSDLDIAAPIQAAFPEMLVYVDNDARCALIGEVWQGAAKDMSSAVLITVGTGIGGAVMQKGQVRPHPEDINKEVGRIVVDPTDVFPSKTGSGTVESFIGGKNLEERLQINLAQISDDIKTGDKEATEIWHAISYFFIQCIRAIHTEYSCKNIIVGGIGVKDLPRYLQDPAPCPVVPALLGEAAALYGAARLAIDFYEEEQYTDWE
ncbi:MAG: hypothetical protein K0S20_644 [Patescibacteria group bacterium]|nr:hypothetical protein [Patescibacteria group bacterium]